MTSKVTVKKILRHIINFLISLILVRERLSIESKHFTILKTTKD